MNEQERDYKSMQGMRRALGGIESPQEAKDAVMESEAEDSKEDAAGSVMSSVFQAIKHYDYTWAPNGMDFRIDEEGKLHITATFNAGTWEESGPGW